MACQCVVCWCVCVCVCVSALHIHTLSHILFKVLYVFSVSVCVCVCVCVSVRFNTLPCTSLSQASTVLKHFGSLGFLSLSSLSLSLSSSLLPAPAVCFCPPHLSDISTHLLPSLCPLSLSVSVALDLVASRPLPPSMYFSSGAPNLPSPLFIQPRVCPLCDPHVCRIPMFRFNVMALNG